MDLTPDWRIFNRVPITAMVAGATAGTCIRIALWIRNGMFGRSHNGMPINLN